MRRRQIRGANELGQGGGGRGGSGASWGLEAPALTIVCEWNAFINIQ